MLRLRRRTDTLVADSLTMEENETQEEDNARYEDELCPECGNMTGSTDVCASCGAKRMTAAATPDKVRTVMHEFKTGKLRLRGKGGKPGAHVTDRKQAIAIALSEARRAMTAAAFTAEERRNMAEKGIALADGSYPIPDVEYLRKAIHALGRASQHGDYDKVKLHIVKRARALKAVDELPSEWNITASSRPRLRQTLTAAFGTRAFDESKVRRVPKGSKGGGQFTVKENAAGRFEVVDKDTGKKVAEATTESDANAIAEHRNEAAPYTPPAEAPAPAPSPVEGPFTYPSGWTGRYDPVEGRYIGLDDVYMPADFDPMTDPGRAGVAMPEARSAISVPPSPPDPVALRDELIERSGAMGDTEFSIKAERLRQAGGYWPRGLSDWQTPEGRALREEIARRRGTTGILSSADEADAIVAAIPVHPPEEWFANPELEGPTPITVTSDGRIYGHAAVWGTCHLGNPRGAGVCVQPPRSQTDYGLFHLGEIETEGGGRVPVGQITLDTGHAPLGASARTAAAHYDDTGTVVADVTAGEDEHGIYFAGALRPDVTPERLRKLTASKISGDWRGGELVGMLAVNVPGFPVPRTKARLVASGDGTEEVLALVAAGIVGERELDARELEIRVQVLAARAEGGIDALADLAER